MMALSAAATAAAMCTSSCLVLSKSSLALGESFCSRNAGIVLLAPCQTKTRPQRPRRGAVTSRRCSRRLAVAASSRSEEDAPVLSSSNQPGAPEPSQAQNTLPPSASYPSESLESRDEYSSAPDKTPFGLMAVLAAAGAAETGYLTWQKLTGGDVFCPLGGGCGDILNSAYASVAGLPLSLFGFLAYSFVAILSAAASQTNAPSSFKETSRSVLLLSASAMSATGAYLLFIIGSEFEGLFCEFCSASAALSAALLVASLRGFPWPSLQRLLLPQVGVTAATLLSLSLVFGDARQALAGTQVIDLPPIAPAVTTVSSPFAVQLAQHLQLVGAKMYGAFWCSHCNEQKQDFGLEASKYLPYTECFPEGYRRGVVIAKECSDAKIEGFPTWIIDGKAYPGSQDLQLLARVSGFTQGLDAKN